MIRPTRKSHEIRKVAVAFDPACSTSSILQAASEFAVLHDAELEALLVHDQDMARLSRLPFGRIIEPVSGKMEEFDDAAIRSRRAGPVARSRAVLRDLSQRYRLTCTVREIPGLSLVDVMTESTAELFVVASSHGKFGGIPTTDPDALQVAMDSAASVLLVSELPLPLSARNIVVICDESERGRQAMTVAERLARRESPTGDPESVRQVRPDHLDATAIVQQIRSLAPGLVIIGLSGRELTAQLHEQLDHAAFSVLTVR